MATRLHEHFILKDETAGEVLHWTESVEVQLDQIKFAFLFLVQSNPQR